MATQTQVDNTLAIRLACGAIKNIAQDKRISKKKIMASIKVMEEALGNLEMEPIVGMEKQEKKYLMAVKHVNIKSIKPWELQLKLESHIPPSIEEKYAVEKAQKIVDEYNEDAARMGLKLRKLVRVTKVITHTKELYNGK